MIRHLLPLLLLLACANPTGTGARQDASSPAAPGTSTPTHPTLRPLAADADCTLATELVPGIPGSPGHPIKSARNPNGDSELSFLMRQFVDDWYEARSLLAEGKPVPARFAVHRKMRCSWHTKPHERNETYDGMAQGYLAMVQAFDAAPSQSTYNAVIQSCVSCHNITCGGVIDFIETLRWR